MQVLSFLCAAMAGEQGALQFVGDRKPVRAPSVSGSQMPGETRESW
jgi:hypothetical protein